MANAFTVNLVLTKPEVGADSNLWGGHLNGDMDILDGIFTSASTTFVSIVQRDDSKYVNAATTSKGFILSASLVSTSTTRTLSVPDATGTIALQSYVDAAVPPTGVVIPWAGVSTTAPTGWLLCGGQAVSRTTYLTLFNAVNTAYGAGDGSTTFNVPDLRGRTIAGLDNIGGSAANRLTATTMSPNGTTMGATGGAQTENASVTITGSASVNGSTSGPNNVAGTNTGGGDFATALHGHNISLDAPVSGSGSTAVVTNVQPTLTLNYIIKT